MMPGRDGFEVCKTLKRDPQYAEIPIILLSARGQEHDRERGLCLGAVGFRDQTVLALGVVATGPRDAFR